MDERRALLDYLAMLMERNAHVNLIGPCTFEEGVVRHLDDSVAPLELPEVNALFVPGARVADVGTGAGLPGVPLAVMRPETRVTLVDALKKRVDFLSDVIAAFSLSAEAVHARAEDFARDEGRRGSYDIAVSRAVASLPVLLEYTLPLLKVGGTAIYYKGPKAGEEVAASERALAVLGGDAPRVLSVPLPGTPLEHCVILVRKARATPAAYPRKAGVPEKAPL